MKKILLAPTLLLCAQTFALDVHNTPTSTFPLPTKVEDKAQWKPHVGIMAGSKTPEGSQYDSAAELGVDVGFQPFIPFGVGAELTTANNEANDARDDLDRTTLLLRGTYNFGGNTPVIRDSFIGFAIGAVFKPDGTEAASAPMLGFDIPLKDSSRYYVSLGANAKYLITSGSEPDSLSVNGIVKYWY